MSRRILIVEDEEGLVLSLEDRLRSEGYEVVAVGEGVRGESEAAGGTYDLIILDVMLPGRDGFQVCQNLREAGLQTPILLLTARSTTIDTVMGLRIGADDYLTKPFDMQVLLARIQALLRRAGHTLPARRIRGGVYRFGEFCLNGEKRELKRNNSVIPLSLQEYKLLLVFVQNPDCVLTRNELLNESWSYDSETMTRTVDVHVARLRQKLGEKIHPHHLLTVLGHGYKFVPNPPGAFVQNRVNG